MFRGSLRGLGELAVEMAKSTVLNIATAGLYGGYGLATGIWHGYQEDGLLGAVNAVNPLYGLGRMGAETSMAAENGDYDEAAAAGVKVVVLTAAAVLGGMEEGAAIEGGAAKATARGVGKANTPKSTLFRDRAGNFLPDPAAEGRAHTMIGIREGRNGTYTQGATFDGKGRFRGITDITNHGRADHPRPHFHPAKSSSSIEHGPHSLPGPEEFLP